MNSGDLIPEQLEGMESNTESSHALPTLAEAISFFDLVKDRLRNVNDWHSIAGTGTAEFQLTDDKGDKVSRTVQEGDHFRIDVPGPGSQSGDGYDWVKVEEVKEDQDQDEAYLAITVRPVTSPLNEKKDVAHFFADSATSSFIVKRKDAIVTAGVYGRNEKPNTKAETIIDKARNTAMATGAVSGFSKLQWKSLVNGLIKH
jgi:hypothetical protein